MKKLLVIQNDEAYFLFESLQVLEKFSQSLKGFELTLLVSENSLNHLYETTSPVISGITTSEIDVLEKDYDISVNLSLSEKSWQIHGDVNSKKKIGSYYRDQRLIVEDVWSSYLLTLKSGVPFLTFHLQDIYRNILGFRAKPTLTQNKSPVRRIAYATISTNLFKAEEQEELINKINHQFPKIPLLDISEVDLVSDLSDTLYIGPASLQAVKFAECGGRCLLLSGHFQGLNFIPYSQGHVIASSRGKLFDASTVLNLVEQQIRGEKSSSSNYSLYSVSQENVFGAHLKCLNTCDDNYPFYQSHLVLWNYVLNLHDINLEVSKCSKAQIELLSTHVEILRKYLRLHDYAMTSIDIIHQEAKAKVSNSEKIDGHLKNLAEIEEISNQLATSHSFLRSLLDFYRIRRGQNEGTTLFEQAQSSFLTYSEEHQAVSALIELFSVTLKKNEVSI